MKDKNKKIYYIYKMNGIALNVISLVLFIIMILLTYFLYPNVYSVFDNMNLILLFVITFGYLVLHELLHSLAYVIYGGKYNKIIYGIALELGVFYCLCKQNISKNNILHSLLYPFVFIGIITYVIGIFFDIPLLIFLSVINITGCSGDIIMFLFIRKLKDIEFSEMDDPISFGIYTNKDISKISHFGLDYLGTKEKIDRNDFTKIIVSKPSKYILIILLVLLILAYII